MVLFCFLSFNGISIFVGYFMLKLSLNKNTCGSTKSIAWKDRTFHMFPNGISSKVNSIARLGLELAYDDVITQHGGHCNTNSPTR